MGWMAEDAKLVWQSQSAASYGPVVAATAPRALLIGGAYSHNNGLHGLHGTGGGLFGAARPKVRSYPSGTGDPSN